ncbi:uncharacterized protein [Venturia canescens]|uniref:uncharacterized protein n=1 Tax=Venturia canescens TaxID=32260 RepID=UPI001C9D4B4E|nr:uncharacterized protein LOC122412143 [Venturia canescens]
MSRSVEVSSCCTKEFSSVENPLRRFEPKRSVHMCVERARRTLNSRTRSSQFFSFCLGITRVDRRFGQHEFWPRWSESLPYVEKGKTRPKIVKNRGSRKSIFHRVFPEVPTRVQMMHVRLDAWNIDPWEPGGGDDDDGDDEDTAGLVPAPPSRCRHPSAT